MLKWLFALVLLLTPTLVSAQTHPCDVVYPTLFKEPVSKLPSLVVGWCAAPVDLNDLPLTGVVGFILSVNGIDSDLGAVQPKTAPNSQGWSYYEVKPNAFLAQGTIIIKVYTAMNGMSAPSAPVTLTLSGSPRPPRNTVIYVPATE